MRVLTGSVLIRLSMGIQENIMAYTSLPWCTYRLYLFKTTSSSDAMRKDVVMDSVALFKVGAKASEWEAAAAKTMALKNRIGVSKSLLIARL